jgi:hypothetical protein
MFWCEPFRLASRKKAADAILNRRRALSGILWGWCLGATLEAELEGAGKGEQPSLLAHPHPQAPLALRFEGGTQTPPPEDA